MRHGCRNARNRVEALERRWLLAASSINELPIQIGGDGFDASYRVAVDTNGDSVVTGIFSGQVDFDPGPSVKSLRATGQSDIFIARYSPSGKFVWAGHIGGGAGKLESKPLFTDVGETIAEVVNNAGPFIRGAGEYPYALSIGSDHSIYLGGAFQGTANFNPFADTNNIRSGGFYDAFLEKLSPSGKLVWVKTISGPFNNVIKDFAIDPSGNVFATGYFTRTVDFDPSRRTLNLTALGRQDIFVTKYSPSGSLVWADQFGSDATDLNDIESGESIAVNSSDQIYLTGTFAGKAEFDPGPGQFRLKSDGRTDTFILHLTPAGKLAWVEQTGGGKFDGGYQLAIGSGGDLFVAGYFSEEANLNPHGVPVDLVANDSSDIEGAKTDMYVTRLSADGELKWVKQFSGAGFEYLGHMTLDANDDVLLTGGFSGITDFNPARGLNVLSSVLGEDRFDDNGSRKYSYDIFIAELNSGGGYLNAISYGSTSDDYGVGVAWSSASGVVDAGRFKGTVDFAQGTRVRKLRSNGSDDAFLLLVGELT